MRIMHALLCVKIETGGNRARVFENTHGVFSENREGSAAKVMGTREH